MISKLNSYGGEACPVIWGKSPSSTDRKADIVVMSHLDRVHKGNISGNSKATSLVSGVTEPYPDTT